MYRCIFDYLYFTLSWVYRGCWDAGREARGYGVKRRGEWGKERVLLSCILSLSRLGGRGGVTIAEVRIVVLSLRNMDGVGEGVKGSLLYQEGGKTWLGR